MSTVSLIRTNSYQINELEKSIEELLEPLGGINTFVKPGDRVLLKPNLLTGSRPTKECVTRREIVYCVAKIVKKAGGKPFLGDSPAFGSALGVAKANGYLSLLEEFDLPIVEFHGKRYETVSQEFNHLLLSKSLENLENRKMREFDYVVDFLKFILLIPIVISEIVILRIPGLTLIKVCENLEMYNMSNKICNILIWHNNNVKQFLILLFNLEDLEEEEMTNAMASIFGRNLSMICLIGLTIASMSLIPSVLNMIELNIIKLGRNIKEIIDIVGK
ncbi:DUF362 domain-containing protein [Okeania sp. KiyG1]|uniref:DUF362 domain-containing protein n=1 Tax=Okeania sp. KiyG1 TaxID=2720165 RepID=UPI0019921A5F|nr:DUF362 domain-containing protein [Okeania sp. KiyG1]GGA14732.1 hypothetical protein CYANOKiyG1_28450 [Okeania sp. KiyG1]